MVDQKWHRKVEYMHQCGVLLQSERMKTKQIVSLHSKTSVSFQSIKTNEMCLLSECKIIDFMGEKMSIEIYKPESSLNE